MAKGRLSLARLAAPLGRGPRLVSGRVAEPDLLILGAGVAGLTAAVGAVARGLRPLVVESAPGAGGRARSFYAPSLGEVVDNGPHLLVGSCRETLDLLEKIGSRSLLRPGDTVRYTFWTRALGWHHLTCPDWPAPWQMLAGLWRFPGLSWRDRLVSLRMGGDCLLPPKSLAAMSVTHWLLNKGQSQPLFQRFWSPLCLAILNEPPASANARLFAQVLGEMFFRHRQGAVALPMTRPLGEIFAAPALRYIQEHGGAVEFGRRVTALQGKGDRLLAIETNRGTLAPAAATLCTLPMRVVRRLLPDWSRELGWQQLEHAPIVSVHLRYDRPARLPDALVGLPENTSQWLMDRGGEAGEEAAGARLSAVLSGAYREIHWSEEKLVAAVHGDVAHLFPHLQNHPPVARLVVRERFATLAAWPGCGDHRPATTTRWKNFHLAGDWTATGLPATLEGAVRSANHALSMAGAC